MHWSRMWQCTTVLYVSREDLVSPVTIIFILQHILNLLYNLGHGFKRWLARVYWKRSLMDPYMKNELAHHYHLYKSTVIFRGIRNDFDILFRCSMKLLYANIIAQDRHHILQRHIWGYTVCLCPIKRMACLYELRKDFFGPLK